MNAYLCVRNEPHYRFDAFRNGLIAAGFKVHDSFPNAANDQRGNVLVIWNRYGHWHQFATAFAAAGGRVLVAENGVIGKDANGIQLYQLCRDYHAGHGTWHIGEEDRWSPLNIELKNWRQPGEGKFVLICEQRSIGVPPVASPMGFAQNVANQLKGVPHHIRIHPESPQGKQMKQRPLDEDLADASCVVVWTSTVGVRALTQGIPVIYQAQKWIASGCATRDLSAAIHQERLCRDDAARLKTLKELAWSQWTVKEIATGIPFRFLCT